MDGSRKSKKVASPHSTGGGVPDYEDYVGAYYLAMMLLCAVPRGQNVAAAREIQFQSLYRGEPLDDLVVRSSLPQREIKLALQIKHDLTFGERIVGVLNVETGTRYRLIEQSPHVRELT